MAIFTPSVYGGSLRGGGMMGLQLPQPPAPPQAMPPQQAPGVPPQAPQMPPQAQGAPQQAMPPQPGQQPPQQPPMQPQGAAKLTPQQQQMIDKFPAMLQNAKSVADLVQAADILSQSGVQQLKMIGDALKQKIEQEKSQGKPEDQIVDEFKKMIESNQPPSGEAAKG